MIGSLLYLAVCTRPNISFSVAVLARQVHTPISRNLALVKRIMRYVAGTSDFGLLYPRSCPVVPQSLHASADADWGGCKETRKSNSGWVIAIYGTTIVWRTRKQSIIAIHLLSRNIWLSSIALKMCAGCANSSGRCLSRNPGLRKVCILSQRLCKSTARRLTLLH